MLEVGGRVTIYDIAAAAGVGIATVSRVLNGDRHVRADTRATVQDAIASLGYRPSRAARRLAQGQASRPRVAALVPFFTASFYFAVTRSLAHALAAADIDLAIHDIKHRADKNRILDRLLAERACEGLVLISCGIGADRRAELDRLGIPAVCADAACAELPAVTVDNTTGGRLAAEHLRACGCRHPAVVAGPRKAASLNEREEAFRTALDAAPVVRAGAVGQEAGRVAARELLAAEPAIDGLFCVNDMLAVGALEALAETGRAAPDPVQVIGFDDQPLMDFIGLTTIRQPIAGMGRWAASSIAHRIHAPREPGRSKRLPVELIVRRTTRPPPP